MWQSSDESRKKLAPGCYYHIMRTINQIGLNVHAVPGPLRYIYNEIMNAAQCPHVAQHGLFTVLGSQITFA